MHRWMKGDNSVDAMFSAAFGGLCSDPTAVIKEKVEEWSGVWARDEPELRAQAAKVTADAINRARHCSEPTEIHSAQEPKHAAKSYRATTSIGADKWPLSDLGKCSAEDLARYQRLQAGWDNRVTVPAQWCLNVMSMIPKHGSTTDVRLVVAMASGFRNQTRLAQSQERAWNRGAAHKDDDARPGSSCLEAMEVRQFLLDGLGACGCDVLEMLWAMRSFTTLSTPRSSARSSECPITACERRRKRCWCTDQLC